MAKYWVIAPAGSNPPERFEQVWQFDLAQNLISIGWQQLGDISKLTKDELTELVISNYLDKPVQTRMLFANMLWSFYHEMLPGDYIIARRGRKMIAGVGRITGSPKFDPGRNSFIDHGSFIEVSWQYQPRNKSFPMIVFPMPTIAEYSEEKYRSIVEDAGFPVSPINTEPDIPNPAEFVLEKYLEDFIVSNFDSIFKKSMRIYKDSEGNDGQQYETDIGNIDILAVDSDDGFIVIELKKGRPSDQAVGQILRYMGWIKMNLCNENQNVKGLIICRDHDPKLSYALKMTKGIDVRYYNVFFKLRENP